MTKWKIKKTGEILILPTGAYPAELGVVERVIEGDELVNKVHNEVELLKSKLVARALKKGIYENFGQQEVGNIRDKYSDHEYSRDGVFDVIDAFDEWAMNFDDRSLKLARMKAPQKTTSMVKAHTRKTKKGRTAVRGHTRRG